MARKPTYAELEQRIRVLEEESVKGKRAEEALATSHRMLQSLLDAVPDLLIVIDREYRIKFTNSKGHDLILQPDVQLQKTCYGRFKLLDRPCEDCSAMPVFETGCIVEREMVNSADGRNREVRAFPVLDTMGKVDFVCEHVRDITERKQVEEELRESEEKYRDLYEEAPVGYHEIDTEGRIVRVNRREMEILGYTAEEMVGQPMWNFVVEKEAQETVMAKLAGDKSPSKGLERTCRRKDGTTIPVLIDDMIKRDREGRITGIRSTVQDITEPKRAEEELHKSETRFRAIFENSPISIWEEDFSEVKGRFDELRQAGVRDFRVYLDEHPDELPQLASLVRVLDVNETSVRVLGAGSKDQLVRELPRYFIPESLDVFKEQMITLAEGKTRFQCEIPIVSTAGQPMFLSLSLAVLPGYETTLSKMLVSFLDITERKRAAAALRESEEKYRILVENAGDAIFVAQQGMLKFANAKSEEIIGRTREELTSRPFIEFIHPDDRGMVLDRHIKRQQGVGLPSRYSFRIAHPSGDTRWVELNTVLIEWEGKAATLNFLTDITERKRMEETLRESEARFRSAFENAAVGMALVGPDGIYLEANIAMARMIGYTPAELIGKPVADFTHPEDLKRRAQFIDDLLAGRIASGEQERRFVHRNGSDVWVLILASVQRDSQGRPLNFVSLIVDNTSKKKAEEETKRLEAQFTQAQKMESVGRLAGGVAHDFNNMLGVIIGQAELAMLQVDPADPLTKSLQEILKASQRSADLVRQLLAFARKQTVSPKVLNLNDTVSGMLKMLRRLIGEDIDLAWMPGHDLWQVKMDPSQIDQILANLVVNARDAIAGVGKVIIETASAVLDEAYCADYAGCVPGEYVLLTVSDDGAGMSKDILEHLFEPFFTTKELGKGTGLGLATVYGIVKQNNGFINVYSESGHGTTFKLYLPRCESEFVGAPIELPAETLRSGTETVMLVEDEATILEVFKAMLEGLGYTVLIANTPGEAMRMAGEHAGDIHLLISDVVMPEMNGRDMAERLYAIRPGLKCLFMSGYTANVIAHHGVLDKGVLFIHKPFSMKDLAAKVREALDKG